MIEYRSDQCCVRGTPAKFWRRAAISLTGLLLVAGSPADASEGGRTDAADRTAASTCAGANDPYSGMISMFSAVPNYQAFVDGVSINYVDYGALDRATDGITVTGWSDIKAMDDDAFQTWSAMISRLQTDPLNLASEVSNATFARSLPDLFPAEESAFGGLPGVLGVDWLAVDRALSFAVDSADQPLRWTLLGGEVGLAVQDRVGAALSGYGLVRSALHDIPVWHRFGDREVKPEAMAPANVMGGRWMDPFGIRLGAAARIAVLPCILAGSPEWDVTNDIIQTAFGAAPSLADSDSFRAAARAVTDPSPGQWHLVQVWIDGPNYSPDRVSFGRLGPYSTPAQRESLAASMIDPAAGPLPEYELVALADRRVGNEDVVLVALVYRDERAAIAAATTLPRRLNRYVPIWLKMPLAEGFDVDIRADVFRAAEVDRFVTVAVIRDIGSAESTDERQRTGRLYGVLQKGLMDYDADYLVPNR